VRLLAKASLLLLVFCGSAVADPQKLAPHVKALKLVEYRQGTAPPRFDGQTLDGRRLSLGALRGKVVLVNFWASWCAECRPEMPVLQRLHREFAAQGLAVVGVNAQETKQEVARYVHDLGLTFPIVLDPDRAIGADYGVFGLPATFVVARDGRAVAFAVGAREWEGASARSLIRSLLAEPAPLIRNSNETHKK